MSTVQIKMRDDLRARVTARAAESGFDDIESYIQSLVQSDAEQQEITSDIEALLLQRLRSGSKVLLTPALERHFKRDVARRRRSQ